MADKDPPTKEICHWTKSQLGAHFVLLSKIVAEPNFACTKCGRAANAKKWLCKPRKLKIEN